MKPARRRPSVPLALLLSCMLTLMLPAAPCATAQAATSTPTRAPAPAPDVRELARALAQRDYVAPVENDLPAWLAEMDFDAYRQLHFRPEQEPWAADGLPFRLSFAHRGYLFRSRVSVHELADGSSRELRFNAGQFRGAPDDQPAPPEELGYAGVAIAWRHGEPRGWDEVASFLGASYFRLVGIDQTYGASARGLAIDTAMAQGEEFPRFTEFWIEKPAPDATTLTIHALLDSPALTGAFRFVLTPGERTSVEVTASLFPRHEVDKLGLAALTSMFLFGEDGLHRVPDYRPEVHDSDGLLIDDGHGEWLWRPLGNPLHEHRVSRFPLENPAGFGLMQRDRAFGSYEDPGARFETRPGLWVAPHGAWGKGAVELVEIPTPAEWNDNIVAYWVPEAPLVPGEEFRFGYSVSASLDEPSPKPQLRTRATRLRPGADEQLFVLDFDLPSGERGPPPLGAEVTPTRGEIRHLTFEANEPGGGYRCTFELVDAGSRPLELRVRLLNGEQPVSETLVLNVEAP